MISAKFQNISMWRSVAFLYTNNDQTGQNYKNLIYRGVWVAHLVVSNSWFQLKSQSQGGEIKPQVRLFAQQRVCFPSSFPFACVHTLSLSQKNKYIFKKIKNRIALWSSNPNSGYISKRIQVGSQRQIYIPMLTVALFTTVKWEKQAESSQRNR